MSSPTPPTDPADAPTSARLLARARAGDSGALARLIERCLPGLRRWAHGRLPRWVRTTSDTSDLIQDAIVRTLSRLDAFEPEGRGALAAYLRTAVQHRIADEHRRARRWLTCDSLPDKLVSRDASPLDAAIGADEERRYRIALSTLTQRDQELIVAHVELDYSHAQLGCMIGRSPNAARMALSRALARLTVRMQQA